MKTLNEDNRQKVTEFLRGLHTEIEYKELFNELTNSVVYNLNVL